MPRWTPLTPELVLQAGYELRSEEQAEQEQQAQEDARWRWEPAAPAAPATSPSPQAAFRIEALRHLLRKVRRWPKSARRAQREQELLQEIEALQRR